ncbi:MAG: DUF1524 domain-containing protein [Reyranellaceae bacterium]
MNEIEHVPISIQEDFLARQTRAQPIAALAELIWNGLDGEAGRVDVEFERTDLAGGISKVVVYDDGKGFPRSEAAKLFGNLGGSWKRLTRRTRIINRMVHGQEGRGRYKAFALGRSIVWKVCYLDAGKPKAFEITLLESDLKDVAITEERDAPGRASGVVVEITNIKRDFRVLQSDEVKALMDERQRHIDTLGNLTLLTEALNPSLKNAAWAVKRKKIANSLLAINRDLASKETWSETTITERANLLAKKVNGIWPGV